MEDIFTTAAESLPIEQIEQIDCVKGCLNPATQWDQVVEAALNPDLRFVFSNTTEAGIAFNAADTLTGDLGTFPAKITKILYQRFRKYGEAGRVELLPLELIEKKKKGKKR